MSNLELGLRVVRGPDWNRGEEDEGEGHVGTVVRIRTEDKTVDVRWDSGAHGTSYRTGPKWDLRILDSAPTGVKHDTEGDCFDCDHCREYPICGLRWRCTRCPDFDLCTECYMSDKHDLTHPFQRLEKYRCVGVVLPERQGAFSLPMKGIFIGATVVRGPDWEWDRQDGGEGTTGEVIHVTDWNSVKRSCGRVKWTSGVSAAYRLGYEGKVDLKCTHSAVGGNYYPDHLPYLGQRPEDAVYVCTVVRPPIPETPANGSIEEGDPSGSEEPTSIPGPYDPTLSDVLLRCGGTSFAVHRVILTAGSPVLGRLLHDVPSLDVHDMTPETLRLLLSFLYSGGTRAEDLGWAEALELYRVSGEYEVPALRDDCAAFLADGLSVGNVCDVLSLESLDGQLKAATDRFLYQNFDAVVRSAKWSDLVARNPSVAGTVLTDFAKRRYLVKENCLRQRLVLVVFVILFPFLMMMVMDEPAF